MKQASACDGVAIIGMAIRFPGAPDIGAFWSNLRLGIESISQLSETDLIAAGVSSAELENPRYVRAAALVDGVPLFDAEYFGLTPREASVTSPEQRLLMECAEEALQDAGYGARQPGAVIGVFVGTGLNTYLLDKLRGRERPLESTQVMALLAANTCAAARLAYVLDLTGPSITLDTACSSSLVAVHEACRAILHGECEMALAGGASVRHFGPRGYLAEEGGVTSPDGHCRPFHTLANGTVSGSGAGLILLKRMSTAIGDGDFIYAVIKGTAVNNDGGTKAGYTAPSAAGQATVIRRALDMARLDPSEIDYLEAHGTGTAIGDAIEIAALTDVFPRRDPNKRPCVLGALKANIGHLEAASGIAGLIKAALALKYREIPPAIHFRRPSEGLALRRTPFTLNPNLEDWSAGTHPRRAGVSAFGIGGTNSHVVLEEAPQANPGVSGRPSHLLVLAARTATALGSSCRQLALRLSTDPPGSLADIAYTLQTGRKAYAYRTFVVATEIADATRALQSAGASDPKSAPVGASRPPVVFMFPGQGSQYRGMLKGIYESEPAFRQQLDECAELARGDLGQDLRELLNWPADRLSQTIWCQPALFAVEYSLARLWQTWGVPPSLMIGHSLGEYVAACIAGVLTLKEALRVVTARGRLMERTPAGSMLAVRMSEQAAGEILRRGCSIAAVNGPKSCVLSGPPDEIRNVERHLTSIDIPTKRLSATRAFHSPLMGDICEDFRRVLQTVRWREPCIPYVSNVTGTVIDAASAGSADYWLAQLRQTVQFRAGMEELMRGAAKVFIEVGPSTVLATAARGIPGSDRHAIVTCARHADDAGSDSTTLMGAVGRVWQEGAPIDWHAFNSDNKLHRVSLPTYPFERQRHWIDSKRAERSGASVAHEARVPLADWFYVPVWTERPRIRPMRPDGEHTEGERPECCLLVEPTPSPAPKLAAKLESLGLRLITVSMADRSSCDGQDYTIDSNDEAAFDRLFSEIKRRKLEIGSIIHCAESWPSSGPARAPDEHRLSRGVYSVLEICKALTSERRRPTTITLLTHRAHAVSLDEEPDPCGAMLAALPAAIASEFPEIVCRCIDFARPTSPASASLPDWLDTLAEEIVAPSQDPLVVLRGTTRWIRSYEKLSPQSGVHDRTLLRANGVYMVTGGWGGIGWTVAEFLARTVKARLILVGRSAFPAADKWQTLLESGDLDEPTRDRIKAIRTLEAVGAEVCVMTADVTHPQQVRAVVHGVRARFGRLDGVVHSAGIAGGGAIYLKTREMAARVMAPKVMGTWVVHEACKDLEPDFFLCCSSLASVLAPPGQFDYSAANAYQDAMCLAFDRRSRTRYIAVDWDAWKDVGMSAIHELPPRWREQQASGLAGISREEAVQVLERILANPRPQWIVSTRPIASLPHASGPVAWSVQSAADPAAATETPERRRTSRDNSSESYRAAVDGWAPGSVHFEIARIWMDLLGVQASSDEDDFFGLGGDSLLAVQLRNRLEDHFGQPVRLRSLLDRPTIGGMARLLVPAA